jgi:phenylalanyl-tRNA synthetase beta subunit
MLSAIVTGPRYSHAHDPSQQATDFDDAKGLWEAWLEEMSVDTPEWRAYSSRGWKLGASAEVASATSRIGWAGMLGRETLRSWDMRSRCTSSVLLEPAAQAPLTGPRPEPFPPVRRDMAFFVPEALTHRQLERVRRGAGGVAGSIELFDVHAEPVPRGV